MMLLSCHRPRLSLRLNTDRCGSLPTAWELMCVQLGAATLEQRMSLAAVGKRQESSHLFGRCAKRACAGVLIVRVLDLGATRGLCTAIAAFLGHLFSPFLGFSGGKGVAIGLGVFLGLAPQAILLALGLFAVTFALSRIVSLASLVAAGATPIFVFVLSYPKEHLVAGTVIAVLIIIRHHENIVRLLKGQEEKFSLKKASPPAA